MIEKYENGLGGYVFKQSINRLRNIKRTIDVEVPRRDDAKDPVDFVKPFGRMGSYNYLVEEETIYIVLLLCSSHWFKFSHRFGDIIYD